MKPSNRSASGTPRERVPVPDPNRDIAERTERLRQLVESNGGRQAVSRRARVPLSTLNKYLAGRDMPAANLVRLADACQIRVEWLAQGYVEPTEPKTRPPSPPEPSAASHAINAVDIDRLAEAVEGVLKLSKPHRPWAEVLRAAFLIYDLMQEPGDTETIPPGKQSTGQKNHD